MGHAPEVRALQALVAIPSVNPLGRADVDAAVCGETRCAVEVQARLRRLGADAILLGPPDRRSVVGELRSADPRADTVIIASHLDTVPVDGMTIEPFDPRVDGDRLLGRGSCDTKGGMAALLTALTRVLERGRLRRNVIVVGEADEEGDSAGIEAVLEHLAGRAPAWAIATEPTGMGLVHAHKGTLAARVVTRGRACHGSDPDAGRSALYALGRALLAMEAEHTRLRTDAHPVLGPATLSVGVAGGGHGTNIVPDHAHMVIDRRLLPGETAETVRQQLQDALAGASLADVAEVVQCALSKSALMTAADTPAVRACQEALGACGLPVDPRAVAFGTDAGPLSDAGVPSVVLGPGDIAQAHTRDEWIALRQLASMTAFFERLLG